MEENLGVMSIGFLLSSPDDAVIWRGPKKNGKKTFTFSVTKGNNLYTGNKYSLFIILIA